MRFARVRCRRRASRVRNISARKTPYKKIVLVEATLEDDGAVANAVWFNQPFLVKQLQPGTELIVSGKVELSRTGLTFRNPVFERLGPDQHHVGTLAPVYPETEGITSRFLRSKIEPLLGFTTQVPDRLPSSVREAEGLMPIADALYQVHKPESLEIATQARERIAFEELFLLQVAAERARRRRMSGPGVIVAYDIEVARRFVATLPFKLTDGQRVAAHEILTDLAAPGPMNRLLQGDVGSGKTVVAALAALMTHHAGFQTAVMAPTEILARQHHATLEALLGAHGLPPRLLVGSTSAAARREILAGLAGGHDSLIVGTHALIEDDVAMVNLGLVVVDEQHRFGVAQRQRLRQTSGAMPNYLAMTATPIPRSLSNTLYGDVDLSELREMPPGRRPVETEVVRTGARSRAYEFVRAEVRKGRQAFVICPLIEESDKLGAKSATAEYERLSTIDLSRPARRTAPRADAGARENRADAAVRARRGRRARRHERRRGGCRRPQRTIMVIEGAERFGLAQLHQFRGRVGRD